MFVVSSKAHSDAWHLAASARGWAPTEGDEVPQPQVLEVSSELGKRFLFFCGFWRNDFFRAGLWAHVWHVIWNSGFCPQRCGSQEESWAAPGAGHYLRDRLDETWSHCLMGTHIIHTLHTLHTYFIFILGKYQRYWLSTAAKPQAVKEVQRPAKLVWYHSANNVTHRFLTETWQLDNGGFKQDLRLGEFADLQPGARGSTISMLLDIFSSTPSEPSAEGQVQVGHCPKPRRNVGFRIWLNIQVKKSSIWYDFKVRHACVVFFVSMFPSAVCVCSQWCACPQAFAKAKILSPKIVSSKKQISLTYFIGSTILTWNNL